MARRGDQRRWRFYADDGRLIEVEVEPASGFFLGGGGGAWDGVHIKARLAPGVRRWNRANLVEQGCGATEAIEAAAARIV